MAGFGAKVKLTVDKSGKKEFNDQINSMVSQIKVSNKFTVLQKDMDRVRREAQTMLNNGQIVLKVKKIDCSAAVTDVKRQLQGMLSSLSVSNGVNITGLKDFLGTDGVDAALQKTAAGATAAVDKLNQAKATTAEWAGQMKVLDSISKSLAATYRSGLSGKNMIADEESLAAITADYNAWQQKIESVRSSQKALSADELDALQSSGIAIQRKITSIQNEQIELERAAVSAQRKAGVEEAAARKAAEATKEQAASIKQISALYERLSKYLGSNSKVRSSFYGTNIQSMMDMLGSGDSISITELQQMEERFARIRSEITQTGLAGRSLFDSLNRAYQKFGGWMLVTRSLMAAIRSIKDMVTNVRELDTAMTELRKVTDATDQEYADFFDRATVRAKQLGATVTDTINASADFARLGYTMEESADLADAALVYKNVGDGISDIGDASESVISTMKAFNIEATDAMFIVDKFNEVGNNFAISSKGVGDALLRSASAMVAANNTLDETIALITAANSVVQDPDKVGTALKTVSMFLRAAKTEAEEAGESTDGMAESVSKLRDELLSLTGGKVDIQIDESTFKSTYQIMKELSQVWGELSDISQANILETIGGKRNSNVVSALLTNFSIAEDVLKTSAESAGSALAENEKYLNSINGKIAQFQAAFESLSAAFISSGFVKGVVDFGTGVLDTLTSIIEKLGSIPALAAPISAAFTVYKSAKGQNFGFFDVVDGDKIGVANNALSTLSANFRTARDSGMDFSSSLKSALSGAWSGATSNISKYNRLLNSSGETQAIFMKYLESSDDTLAGYLKTLNGGAASLSGYKAYCKQAGVEVSTLGVKSKAASIGVTILNTAMNMFISMVIALAIQGIISAITSLATASEKAIEKANELNEAFREFRDTNQDNISTLNSLRNEFEELASGVSQYGDNVALTADEYDRYKKIVEQIVGISPELIEGYDAENGYLVDKNRLLERAIELQNEAYQNELRSMTTTDNIKVALDGFLATYNKLSNGDVLTSDTDLSNSIWQMFRINDRDDISSGRSGDGKSKYLAEQIISSLGIDDVESEMEKYFNQYGYFQWGQFWDDYADSVAQNIDRIASTIDFSEAGYVSKSDFEAAIENARSAATQYEEVRDQLEQVNRDVANQFKLAAESNEKYSSLSNEAKSIVSNFVNSFGIDDVTVEAPWYKFWKTTEISEDEINNVKAQINKFIDNLTPEVQNALSGVFDLKGFFDSNDINANEFKTTVDYILKDLEAAGFDDETIRYIKVAIDMDQLEEQIEHAKELLSDEFDDDAMELTSQELTYSYKIQAEPGSMTLDELRSEIRQMRIEGSAMVNVLDFTELINGLSEASDGLTSIISAMKQLRDGTALTVEQLAKLALEYPKLLEQSNLFTDGSVEGQQNMLNAILDMNEQAYDAQIDAKIAELEAQRQLINDQLDLETQKANVIAEIKNTSVNGVLGQEEELVQKISELNDLQGKNYVTMEDGVLKVNEEALNEKLQEEHDYGVEAAEKIWEPYAEVIKSAHTEGFSASLKAVNSYGSSLFTKIKNIASNIWGALSQAVSDAISGNWKGLSSYFSDAFAGGTSNIDAGTVTVTFDGEQAYVGEQSISDWVSEQEAASAERIAALKTLQERTVNAINNLQELKGLDLTDIYGSTSGSKSSSAAIEEYTADIERYREALEKLSRIRIQKQDLEFELSNTDDLDEKILLEKRLLGVYESEQEALENLNVLRDNTIKNGVTALEQIGFNIDYDADSNKLFVNNLEHLNELVADNKGKYSSTQEATNALRQDTENLINTLVELNEVNQKDADAWQSLSGSIRAAKVNIVNNLKEIVSRASDAVDEIQHVYDTLKDAADEYTENGGFISVDAFQKIVELGPQYMQYLRDENGLLVINEENVKRIIIAKTEQLALENAMAYVERLRLATQQESVEDLNEILFATTQTTDATWGLVYAEIALMQQMGELNDSQYDAAIHNINAIHSLSINAIDGIYQISDKTSDKLNAMKSGLDDILKYVMDMLRQKINDQIDAINEMKDAYGELIDLKKKSMEATREETDYQSIVAKKIKEIAKLQERINALSLDNSRDAQAKKAKLEEEMAGLQEELADQQADYAIDSQKDSLDKMKDAYEEEKDKEIDILKDSIRSEQKLYEMAISYIESNWSTLYSELLEWNTEYGDVLNSKITTAWDNCLAAAQRYGGYVSAMRQIDSDILSANGSVWSPNSTVGKTDSNTSYSANEAARAIVNRMKENSAKWMSASATQRVALDQENVRHASDLKRYGVSTYRGADGVWYLQDGRKLYSVYHSGGIVGDKPTIRQNETLALLEDGEAILDARKQDNLYELLDFTKVLIGKAEQLTANWRMNQIGRTMWSGIGDLQSRVLDHIQSDGETIIRFGDMYIYGADDSTVEQHREINRQFTNEVLKQLNIKR